MTELTGRPKETQEEADARIGKQIAGALTESRPLWTDEQIESEFHARHKWATHKSVRQIVILPEDAIALMQQMRDDMQQRIDQLEAQLAEAENKCDLLLLSMVLGEGDDD